MKKGWFIRWSAASFGFWNTCFKTLIQIKQRCNEELNLSPSSRKALKNADSDSTYFLILLTASLTSPKKIKSYILIAQLMCTFLCSYMAFLFHHIYIYDYIFIFFLFRFFSDKNLSLARQPLLAVALNYQPFLPLPTTTRCSTWCLQLALARCNLSQQTAGPSASLPIGSMARVLLHIHLILLKVWNA